MKTEDNPPVEDFAQALAALKREYGIGDSDIARTIGVSSAAVGTWVHRKRQPRRENVVALANAYPKFSQERLFTALNREMPGPLDAPAEERLLSLFKELTVEQQRLKEIEMRALAEDNRSKFS